jgi:MFS family permease
MSIRFLGGHFIDRFGPKRLLITLSCCVCAGQALFAVGITMRKFWLIIAGRALFGIGGESVGVAQSCVTTRWFR